MTRRKKIISFACATLAVMAVMAAWVALWSTPAPPVPDPEYQGKKLSYWLWQTTNASAIIAGSSTSYEKLTPQAREAIRAMGTNTVPLIWHELNATDSPFKTRVIGLLRHLPIRALHLTPAFARQTHARDAMFTLGTNAAPLAFYFTRSLNGPEPQLSAHTFYLRVIGRPALPALRDALLSTDPWIRFRAGIIMTYIDTTATNHLPVLVESMLQTRDRNLRLQALKAIHLINPHDHEPLFHALLVCVADADPQISHDATALFLGLPFRSRTLVPYLRTTAAQTNDPVLAKAAREALAILPPEFMTR